jgi:hypothetical protein
MPAGPGFPREKSSAFHLRKNCARRTKGMQGRSTTVDPPHDTLQNLQHVTTSIGKHWINGLQPNS